MKRKTILWIAAGLLLAGLVGVAVIVARVRQQAEPALETGEVIQITAVTSVESSGPVAAQQSGPVFWTTSGVVGAVHVQVGDKVQRGDVLMELDPASASQNVILAQADLIAAQNALDDLLNPTDLAVANAHKALADAQDALDKARRDLKSVENPAGQSLYDAIDDAALRLETAEANLQLLNNNTDVQAYNNAVVATDQAFRRYQDAKARYDESNNKTELLNALEQAQAAYNNALANQNQLALKIQTDTANQTDAVDEAQEVYDQAVRNLNAALDGPDQNKLSIAQAQVAVAEANLAEAERKLDELLNGPDPDDVASAQARVLAAASIVASTKALAPFHGEVVAVNYQVGDTIQQGLAAVTLANRSQLHVDVSVDESDVTSIAVGDPVVVTLDSMPEAALDGLVKRINPLGATVQGLVRYTVRVDLSQTDPRVLIGMTANVTIVTNTDEGALAVPLDAVQLDPQGEFVNRVLADDRLERVPVTSGEVQGEVVVVSGALQPGERVQLVKPQPTGGFPFGG